MNFDRTPSNHPLPDAFAPRVRATSSEPSSAEPLGVTAATEWPASDAALSGERHGNAPSQSASDYRLVQFRNVSLWSRPSRQAAVVTQLESGTRVKVLEFAADRAYVRVQTITGEYGWLEVVVLGVDPDPIPFEDDGAGGRRRESVAAAQTDEGYRVTRFANVVLRTGASSLSGTVVQLPEGTKLRIIEASPHRSTVRVHTIQGQVGWLEATALSRDPQPATFEIPAGVPRGVVWLPSASVATSGSRSDNSAARRDDSTPGTDSRSAQRIAAIAAIVTGAVMAISIFLPWLTVFGIDVSPTDAGQYNVASAVSELLIIAGAGVLAGILQFNRAISLKVARIWLGCTCAAALAEVIYRYNKLSELKTIDTTASLGVGFYLFAICAVALGLTAFFASADV